MPNTHTTLTSLFDDIADAIRAKTGSSAEIVADNFPTEIAAIPSGGMGLPEWVKSRKWDNGSLVTAANFAAVNGLIPCTPSAAFTIYLPHLTTSYTLYPFYFDENGDYLSSGTYQSVNATTVARDFNAPAGAHYISFHVYRSGIAIENFDEYYAFSRTK